MSDDLSGMLDACLSSVAQGESIERCLTRYPRHRGELEPLLRSALVIRAGRELEAPYGLRVAGRVRLLNRVAAQQSRPKISTLNAPRLSWGRALAAALTLATISTSAVFASTDALPDEPLYPVKLAVESAQLALASNDVDRARLYLHFAERRLTEEVVAAQRGHTGATEAAAKSYAAHVDQARNIFQKPQSAQQAGDATAERFAEQLERHQANMQEVLSRVPEEARPAIQRVIDDSQQGLRRALEQKQDGAVPAQGSPAKPAAVDLPLSSPVAAPKSGGTGTTDGVTPPASGVDKEPGKPDEKDKGAAPGAVENKPATPAKGRPGEP